MIPVVFRKNSKVFNYSFPKFVTTVTQAKFEIIEQINQGGNSVILKVSKDDNFYALKCDILDIDISQEIKILKQLSTDDSKEYFVSYIDEGTLSTSEKRHPKNKMVLTPSKNFNYYIMEYASSDIRSYLCNRKEKTFDTVFPQVKQLIAGLKKLHESGNLHRDIKPDNILMQDSSLKISDFGLAAPVSHQCSSKQGPKYWPSPEYLSFCQDEDQCATPATDVFQLGCVIFYLFTERYPVGTASLSQLEDNPMKDVIVKMLEYDKRTRLKDGAEVWNELGRLIG